MAEGFGDELGQADANVGRTMDVNPERREVCEPCSTNDNDHPAAVWCETCDELLCHDCHMAHSKFSMMKNHRLHSITDMRTKQRRCKINNKCEAHAGKALEYYCEDHEELGCSQCFVTIHRRCDKVVCISDVVVNETDEFNTLEDIFSKLGKDLKANEEKEKMNKEILLNQHANTRTDMQEAAGKLISFIQKLLYNQTIEEEGKTSDGLKQIEGVEKLNRDIAVELRNLGDLFESEKANNHQLFITIKCLQKRLRVLETKLKESQQKNTVGEYVFALQPELDRVLGSVTELGSLKNKHEVDIEKGTDEVVDLLEAMYFQSTRYLTLYDVVTNHRYKQSPTERLIVSTSHDAKLLYIRLTCNPYQNMKLSVYEGENCLAECNKTTPSDTPNIMDVKVMKSNDVHGVTLLAGHRYRIQLDAYIQSISRLGCIAKSSTTAHGMRITFAGRPEGNIAGIKFFVL